MLTIPIVFSTDDNYVLPLCVAIQSLKNHKNKDVELKIFIFYDELQKKNINLIKKLESVNCGIELVQVSKYFNGQGIDLNGYWWPQATLYRLVAPVFLQKYEKILYLDCDLIVRADLTELFNVKLNQNILAGVKDISFVGTEYINAGVALINVEAYLKEEIFEKSKEYIKAFKPKFLDQDALNYLCKNKITYLDFKYNYMSTFSANFFNMQQAKVNKFSKISILHFGSNVKPWIYKNYPFAKLWWKETKKLPKEIKKEINEKYKKHLKNDKFNDGAFKYMFGSKVYRFFIKAKNKLKIIFKINNKKQ